MEFLGEILKTIQAEVPLEVIIGSVYDLLVTTRSNDDIQTDLYDLLGDQLFEVAELLFTIRADIQQQSQEQKVQEQQAKKLEDHIDPFQGDAVVDQQDQQNFGAIGFNSALFETIFIPNPKSQAVKLQSIQEIPLTKLPKYLHQIFPSSMKKFNRMQSQVFQPAFETSTNLLVSAPTSSGKTNVALLCVCKMIHQFVLQNIEVMIEAQKKEILRSDIVELDPEGHKVEPEQLFELLRYQYAASNYGISNNILKELFKKADFLCVYLTPLKALASEITQKFSEALIQLGLNVLMCTGDESPPQQLIDRANVLILTPEKYDVMTRKISFDDKLYDRQQLIIIDEIHLLGVKNRGPVIEQIVCRTKQYTEQSQSPLRLIGISATIPNYEDIARFMNVPREGLFVFGSEYRPIPMTQFIIGLKESRKFDFNPNQTFNKLRSDQTVAVNQHKHCYEVIKGLQMAEIELYHQQKSRESANLVRNEESKKHQQKFLKEMRDDEILDMLAVNICLEHFSNNNPALLFVHSRKKTVLLAQMIASKIPPQDYDEAVIKSVRECENGVLSLCMRVGIGFHNAGMDKRFRGAVEDQFRKGNLTIVVCTATLAWGVNLPAQTVIIRGTDVMTDEGVKDLDILDVKQIFGRAGRPQYTDSGELGRGIILTSQKKVSLYMRLVSGQQSIDSQLGSRLPDILNAELVLGNISSFHQAYDYIKYTFFFIRTGLNQSSVLYALYQLQQSKLLHCDTIIDYSDVVSKNYLLTPTELGRICSHFYIDFNTLNQFIDLIQKSAIGNVISHADLLHYISLVPQFQNMKAQQDEKEELLRVTGSFLDNVNSQVNVMQAKQIQNKQLTQFVNRGIQNMEQKITHIDIFAQDDEPSFKVNALIQLYMCRYQIKNQNLKNDLRNIMQSLPRIASAFFESLLTFKRLEEALKMNDLLNSIMYQIPFDVASPFIPLVFYPVGTLQQQINKKKDFSVMLSSEERKGINQIIQLSTVSNFQKNFDIEKIHSYQQLMDVTFDELKDKLNQYQAEVINNCRHLIPQLNFDVFASPISSKVIRVQFFGTPCFQWNKLFHGFEQDIQIIFARADNGFIVQQQLVSITQETMQKSINLTFLLRASMWQKVKIGKVQTKFSSYLRQLDYGIEDVQEQDVNSFPQLKVVVFPMLWTGGKSIVQQKMITLQISQQEQQNLLFNQKNSVKASFKSQESFYTPLAKAKPLPVKAIHWPQAEHIFKFKFFNPLQSMMFHTLYYKSTNIFIGAPTSCGKTACSELAILRCIQNQRKAVYIAPMKALTRERFLEWKEKFACINIKVIELTGDSMPDAKSFSEAGIIITTPEKFDVVTRHIDLSLFRQFLGLIVMDEVHLIGTSRGYILESIVARFKKLKIRLLGMSTASSNAKDIAQWLGVEENNIFNFDPNARPVRLDVHIQGFIGEKYCPRMELMNKPVYQAIKQYSPDLPVLVFCSSRRQAHRTGLSLIQQALQDNAPPKSIWKSPNEKYLTDVIDNDALNCLKYGVGIHHAAMCESDRNFIQTLFTTGQINILVATGTLAWGVNVPAFMTIIKGCEYYNKNTDKYDEFDITEINQMIGRAGRPQFIQQRYYNWIVEFFGQELADFLKRKSVFENMYRFDPVRIQNVIKNGNDPDVIELLQQLQQRDKTTPQAVSIIMCKQVMKDFYKQFIQEPLPFESSLLSNKFGNSLQSAMCKSQLNTDSSPLLDILNGEISSRGKMTKQQVRTWLHDTFFFQRARRNPQLYGIDIIKIYEYLDSTELEQLMQYQEEFAIYSGGLLIQEQQKAILTDFFTILEIYTIVDEKIEQLVQMKLVNDQILLGNPSFQQRLELEYSSTQMGQIASDYYLQAKSLSFLDPYFNNSKVLLECFCELPEFTQVAVRCSEAEEMQLIYDAKLVKYQVKDCNFNTTKMKTHLCYQAQLSKSSGAIQLPNSDYYLDMQAILDNALRFCAAAIDYSIITYKSLAKTVEIVRFSQSLIQGMYPEDDDRLQLPAVRDNKKLLAQLNQLKLNSIRKIAKEYSKNSKLQQLIPRDQVDRFPLVKLEVFGKLISNKSCLMVEIEVVLHNLKPQNRKVVSPHYTKSKPLTWFLVCQEPVAFGQKLPFLIDQSLKFAVPASKQLKLYLLNDSYRGFDVEVVCGLGELSEGRAVKLF